MITTLKKLLPLLACAPACVCAQTYTVDFNELSNAAVYTSDPFDLYETTDGRSVDILPNGDPFKIFIDVGQAGKAKFNPDSIVVPERFTKISFDLPDSIHHANYTFSGGFSFDQFQAVTPGSGFQIEVYTEDQGLVYSGLSDNYVQTTSAPGNVVFVPQTFQKTGDLVMDYSQYRISNFVYTAITATTVPELSSTLLISLASIGFLVRRKR